MATSAQLAESERVSFREGQVLHSADLRTEQQGRISARYRHQFFLHRGGIVAGLLLQPTNTGVLLGPGMAIDDAGREILVGTSTKVDLPTQDLARQVWIAYVETPGDGSCAQVPNGPADRDVEFSCLIYMDAGAITKPQDSSVFLGIVTCNAGNWDVSMCGRRYATAYGSRVVAASRKCRMLLGPDGADDPRRFAFGIAAPKGATRDRLILTGDGKIRISGPTSVGFIRQEHLQLVSYPAALKVGKRRFVFHIEDLLNPSSLLDRLLIAINANPAPGQEVGRGSGSAAFLGALVKPEEALLIQGIADLDAVPWSGVRLLTRILNRAVAGVPAKGTNLFDVLTNEERGRLRPDAQRLLLSQIVGSQRRDDELLRRMILEDLFPNGLARLPQAFDGPRGAALADARPEPKQAMPGKIYRTAVKEGNATRQVLRLEFTDSAKEGDPTKFGCIIGCVVSPGTGSDQVSFSPCLGVTADKTVTIQGSLLVRGGQLIQAAPSNDPNDPISQARLVAAVAPWDFTVKSVSLQPPQGGKGTILTVAVRNTGQAPIIAVQINGAALNMNDKSMSEIFKAAQGVTLAPGPAQAFDVELKSLTIGPIYSVHVELLAVGVGPANNILQTSAKDDFVKQ